MVRELSLWRCRNLLFATSMTMCLGVPASANDSGINAIIQGVPQSAMTEAPRPVQAPSQSLSHPAPSRATSDARVNSIIQGLKPRSVASPATISIARSDFFLQLNLHYDRAAAPSSINLRVGQVVPSFVRLMDVPEALIAVWDEAPKYQAVSTRALILLVERRSRKVAFVFNRDTYFVYTPDPDVRIVLNVHSNRFCLIDVKASASWNIQFAYDSDQLLPEARDDLQQIVGLLRHVSLGDYKFVVTGHTDAVGSREYNYDLSLRRAKAVVDHLVWAESIPSTRVKWSGRGFDELLYPQEPRNPRNRRVNLNPTLNEC